jgi:hypothetical protein
MSEEVKAPKIDLDDMHRYYSELKKEQDELLKEQSYTITRIKSLQEELDKVEILVEDAEMKQEMCEEEE